MVLVEVEADRRTAGLPGVCIELMQRPVGLQLGAVPAHDIGSDAGSSGKPEAGREVRIEDPRFPVVDVNGQGGGGHGGPLTAAPGAQRGRSSPAFPLCSDHPILGKRGVRLPAPRRRPGTRMRGESGSIGRETSSRDTEGSGGAPESRLARALRVWSEFADEPPSKPLMPEEADDPATAEVDAVVREFGGDLRAAIRALLHDLAVLAADFAETVSWGYVRGGVSERSMGHAGVVRRRNP